VSNLFNLVSFLFGFIVVPFWVFYVLRDQRKGKRAIDRLLPHLLRADFWALVRIVDQIFGSWIRAQLFLSTVLAVEIWVGLNLLRLMGFQGIQYTVLLAFIGFITSPIPYIANYLAIIPALFMGLQNSIQTTVAIIVVYVISQNVQDNLLSPKINGAALNVHPAILMPLLVVLGRFGLIWVILSGPIAATCRDLFQYVYGRLADPPRPAGLLPRAVTSAAEAERAQAPQDQATAAPESQESPDPTNLPEGTVPAD
jgi:predicted PurR-regulated permease PerM